MNTRFRSSLHDESTFHIPREAARDRRAWLEPFRASRISSPDVGGGGRLIVPFIRIKNRTRGFTLTGDETAYTRRESPRVGRQCRSEAERCSDKQQSESKRTHAVRLEAESSSFLRAFAAISALVRVFSCGIQRNPMFHVSIYPQRLVSRCKNGRLLEKLCSAIASIAIHD